MSVLVSIRANALRSEGITALNASKRVCPQGHAYDHVNPAGGREVPSISALWIARVWNGERSWRSAGPRPAEHAQRVDAGPPDAETLALAAPGRS